MASEDAKDSFYNQLDDLIRELPNKELIVLGDFNARVGSDNDAWPNCLGTFGIGKCNKNGQRLLELCSYHELCITNTYFGTKPHHRVSWRHARSKRWHQLDLIITRRRSLRHVLVTRTYHSADCDTDHPLVCCKISVQPKRLHHGKQNGNPRLSVHHGIATRSG